MLCSGVSTSGAAAATSEDEFVVTLSSEADAALQRARLYLTGHRYRAMTGLGAKLVTDDSMLPPNLQGYAPKVTGVARTNARITISQQGRVIYQSQVAPGPFRIQELYKAISGTLDVQVEEQDGRVQNFKVGTAAPPHLTRHGMVRYKLAAGKPTDWKHLIQGDPFTTDEFYGWSLFGGLVASKNYAALAAGPAKLVLLCNL